MSLTVEREISFIYFFPSMSDTKNRTCRVALPSNETTTNLKECEPFSPSLYCFRLNDDALNLWMPWKKISRSAGRHFYSDSGKRMDTTIAHHPFLKHDYNLQTNSQGFQALATADPPSLSLSRHLPITYTLYTGRLTNLVQSSMFGSHFRWIVVKFCLGLIRCSSLHLIHYHLWTYSSR